MKRVVTLLLGTCLCISAAATVAVAQEKAAGMNAPPKVLVINREVLKPGKGGAPHQKTESAFVRAMAAAKDTTHYLGMDSLSGPSRSLFFTGYDSFADWEKDAMTTQNNATLSAALDRAEVADGDLLQSYETSAFVLRDDLSLNAATDLAHDRYFEIGVFHVKPGHDEDWSAIMKLVKDAYSKIPEVQWAMYQRAYGGSEGYFIYITPLKSAAEIDRNFANGPKFVEAIGKEGMQKLNELMSGSVDQAEINLFALNPAISYVGPEMIKADPTFWKPAPTGEPRKKAEKAAQ
ncbi:MAG TPA: hypothetical protein VIH88_15420 [Candidatus Acidoferrales bacterium]